ncbi:MAG: hypothetical protein ACI83P_000296 [Janthinobacterium sp.]
MPATTPRALIRTKIADEMMSPDASSVASGPAKRPRKKKRHPLVVRVCVLMTSQHACMLAKLRLDSACQVELTRRRL